MRWIFGAGSSFCTAPLIRLACGEPPSPEGEGFGAAELGACRGRTYVVGGGVPPPYEKYVPFPNC